MLDAVEATNGKPNPPPPAVSDLFISGKPASDHFCRGTIKSKKNIPCQ